MFDSAGQKVKGPKRDEVADEIAAFANARGVAWTRST